MSITNKAIATGAATGLVVVALAATVAAVVLLPLGEEHTSAGPDRGVLLTELVTHSNVLRGRTVTVSGKVGAILGPRALVIGGEHGPLADRVLVIVRQRLPRAGQRLGIDRGDVVAVTGTVRRFHPGAIGAAAAQAAGETVSIMSRHELRRQCARCDAISKLEVVRRRCPAGERTQVRVKFCAHDGRRHAAGLSTCVRPPPSAR